MRTLLGAGLAAAVLGATSFCSAQAPNFSGPFKTHQLTSTIYWVEGGGGNSGVIIGDKGVIVIDAKTTADSGKELLDDIAKITPKPVTTVIVTHRDIDHIGGLSSFPKGIEIIAHTIDPKYPPGVPPGMTPPVIVPPTRELATNKEDITRDGVKLELLHWAPAHTTGDTVIYLPEQKIVFTGDIIDGNIPSGHIHFNQGGSTAGWIETAKGVVALDSDVFVPGHGDVENKQQIEGHLNLAITERAKVTELVGQGKSLAEIQAAVGDPPPGRPSGEAFSTVVYRELTGKTQ